MKVRGLVAEHVHGEWRLEAREIARLQAEVAVCRRARVAELLRPDSARIVERDGDVSHAAQLLVADESMQHPGLLVRLGHFDTRAFILYGESINEPLVVGVHARQLRNSRVLCAQFATEALVFAP